MNRGSPLRDSRLLSARTTHQAADSAGHARDRTLRWCRHRSTRSFAAGGIRWHSRACSRESNAERESAVARYLGARGIPFAVHRFASSEGSGDNFAVDLGAGDRVAPARRASRRGGREPGANDNAAAVGILLNLIERLAASPPPKLRLRFLFTAAEERGYLGARHYAREIDVAELAGVLSLELCGIGDSVVIWDAPDATPFLDTVSSILRNIGLARDEGHHVVGRIPMFGSDHRAFAPLGVPAYGFTLVPSANAEALRQFVFSPVRSAIRHLIRRPVPFDTYHTPRDRAAPSSRRRWRWRCARSRPLLRKCVGGVVARRKSRRRLSAASLAGTRTTTSP